MEAKEEKAIFAGGCFWCIQHAFDGEKGVLSTSVGYTGGTTKNPTYEEVSAGTTGHVEALEITYDPSQVSYQDLLQVFWRNIDPESENGQFCDRGEQYRSVIFYLNKEQEKLALESKENLAKSGKLKAIYSEIIPAKTFYEAEEYHQKYYKKNPLRYKYYRYSCGRDKRLKELWEQS